MTQSFNHFPAIARSIKPAAKLVVRKTAFDCQAQVQSKIRANGQVDTGFMLGSVYIVLADQSTYAGGARALPQVGKPASELTAYVAVAAAYGWFQNYGTSRMGGRPFMEPGFEAVRPSFEAALQAIADAMGRATS